MAKVEKSHERVSVAEESEESVGFSDAEISGDCSSEVDLESGISEIMVHLAKEEKDCRICHLSLESCNLESGVSIELGCSCKDDLAAAHKQCAETWFKIKGNRQFLLSEIPFLKYLNKPNFATTLILTCEICGAIACNVVGANETKLIDQCNETTNPAAAPSQETRSFWNGHRFLNFLLACMVFAFVISWLFHFNAPS